MSKLSEAEEAAVEVLAPVMSEAEARQCVEALKSHLVSIRALLVELEERQGWKALGYSSMTACLISEFPGDSKTKLIRALEAGRIERYQQVPIGTYLESQLRPLFKLAPEQWKPTLEKAHQYAGNGRLTATHVSKATVELRSVQLSQIQLVTPSVLPYQAGDIVLINCERAVKEAYTKYNNCWGVVADVLAHSCIVQLMGQECSIHWNDLKEIDLVNETLKQVASRVVTLLQRDDLDQMEREILERYHRQQWFTPWQLQLLQTMENWRYQLSASTPTMREE